MAAPAGMVLAEDADTLAKRNCEPLPSSVSCSGVRVSRSTPPQGFTALRHASIRRSLHAIRFAKSLNSI